jgi:oxygen-independent coproporphyrinogen-3 oxidase
MSGIYLHVPFCRTACHYCDFHFSTSLRRVDDYVKAVVAEIELRAKGGDWDEEVFTTLYLGGGTPSVLSEDQTLKILSALKSSFRCQESWAEATIEVNPEDVTEEALKGWLRLGFNRLSIGVQSFHNSQLEWMNRKHSAEEAKNAVELAFKVGFSRISIDLIYGLPGSEPGKWRQTVDIALGLPIDHISCYSLTIEPRTVLGIRISKGLEKEAPEALVEEDYNHLCIAASEAGLEHYEVSNWSLGQKSRAVHNSSYWSGKPYLGLGAGAHGFKAMSRYSVVSNNPLYISSVLSGNLPDKTESLTKKDRSNELLMTHLRTAEGVDFNQLEKAYGFDHLSGNRDAWEKWLTAGAIVKVDGPDDARYKISEKAWLIGDTIASDFFLV